MPIETRWLVSASASCWHAVEAIGTGADLVDSATADALNANVSELHRRHPIAGAGPRAVFSARGAHGRSIRRARRVGQGPIGKTGGTGARAGRSPTTRTAVPIDRNRFFAGKSARIGRSRAARRAIDGPMGGTRARPHGDCGPAHGARVDRRAGRRDCRSSRAGWRRRRTLAEQLGANRSCARQSDRRNCRKFCDWAGCWLNCISICRDFMACCTATGVPKSGSWR